MMTGRTATGFKYAAASILHTLDAHQRISLVSDFFHQAARAPMSFFDTKLMGDLLRIRMGDHSRVQSFLTGRLSA